MFNLMDNLTFEHIVVFTQDESMFIRARESTSGRTRLFLLVVSQGKAYARNGRQSCWQLLEEGNSTFLLTTVRQEINHGRSVFFIEGDVDQMIQGYSTMRG